MRWQARGVTDRRESGRDAQILDSGSLLNASRASGRASLAHRSYIAPDGWSPSPASNAESLPAMRDSGVTSTYLAPARAASSWFAALNAPISSDMRDCSRPSANGVTLQSGMESTMTRRLSPPANPTARSRRPRNSPLYASGERPRYWLFTPTRRETRPYGPRGAASRMAVSSSSVVHPSRATYSGAATLTMFVSNNWTSWDGQRSFSRTPVPMV